MFVDLFSLNVKVKQGKVKQKTLIGFLVFLLSPPKTHTKGKHSSKMGKPSANNMADVSHQIMCFYIWFHVKKCYLSCIKLELEMVSCSICNTFCNNYSIFMKELMLLKSHIRNFHEGCKKITCYPIFC